MKIVIITGASSGIGAEFVRQLDREVPGVDEFWLVARRKERMKGLLWELRHPVRIFAADIRNQSFYEELEQQMKECQADVKMLVNCAGYGIVGKAADRSKEELLGILDVNCKALTALTVLCLPYMNRNARIIQIASSAAYLPQPGFAVYAASKSYVLSFSRALSEELREREIYVTAVCPGPVDTEFFERAEQYGESYRFKKYFMMSAKDVVAEAIRASKQKQEVVTPGTAMKLFRVFTKIVPHAVILGFIRGYFDK
ncbi:MAG: SDR family NAD(P)-dependent oxidoreductase [Lachnospiraceae bacterium]|nr:SDR family NAD(P)-dependent oxidoreductase [Lachnospiraceae bacterium]